MGKKSLALPMTLFVTLSYGNRIAALVDEAAKLYVSAAAFLSRHPSVANYLTGELLALKELSRELAELFGLALPAPSGKLTEGRTDFALKGGTLR